MVIDDSEWSLPFFNAPIVESFWLCKVIWSSPDLPEKPPSKFCHPFCHWGGWSQSGRNISGPASDFDDFFQWPGIGDAESKCHKMPKIGPISWPKLQQLASLPQAAIFFGWLSSKKLDIGQPGADLAPGVELWGAPGAPGDGTKGGEKMSGCRAKMQWNRGAFSFRRSFGPNFPLMVHSGCQNLMGLPLAFPPSWKDIQTSGLCRWPYPDFLGHGFRQLVNCD